MPIARVQTPDGRIARIEVPDGATDEQVLQFATSQFGQPETAAPPPADAPSVTGEILESTTKALLRGTAQATVGLPGAFIESAGLERLYGGQYEPDYRQKAVDVLRSEQLAIGLGPNEIQAPSEAEIAQEAERQKVMHTFWTDVGKRLDKAAPRDAILKDTMATLAVQFGRKMQDVSQAATTSELLRDPYRETTPIGQRLREKPVQTVLTEGLEQLPNFAVSAGVGAATRGALGAGKLTTFGGAGAASYVLEKGDIFNEGAEILAKQYGGRDSVPPEAWDKLNYFAANHGAFNAMLDAIAPSSQVNRAVLAKAGIERVMSKAGLKYVGKEFLKDFLLKELPQELVQEVSTIKAVEQATGRKLSDDEVLARLTQVGVGTLIPVGAGSVSASVANVRNAQPPATAGEQEAPPTATPPQAGPETPAPPAAPPSVSGVAGAPRRVWTAKGTSVDTNLMVVDADQLTTSHDESGNVNPAFPADLQPRDRSRTASQAQIAGMAQALNPELLGDTGQSSSGAPIVGPDGAVESGNARTLAIRQAYDAGRGDNYRQWLIQNAGRFGIDPDQISTIGKPVLVRMRTTPLEPAGRVAFTQESNQADIAPMAPAELAKTDSARITNQDLSQFAPSEDGNVLAASNEPFLRQFAKRIGGLEAGGFTTADGRWTKQMADRVQAAIFARAYADERLTALQSEEADPEIRNIVAGLTRAAPAFARARAVDPALGNLNITDHLVRAADLIRQARGEGRAVEEVLAQQGLFGDIPPETAALARFMEANKRSPRRMGEAFKMLGERIEDTLRGRQNANLFGPDETSLQDILTMVGARMTEQYGEGVVQGDLLAQEPKGDYRAQTETPEFKRWFGDSKVVDESGKPLAVYHGTTRDFTQFRRTSRNNEDGIFFSPDPKIASAYAGVDPQGNFHAKNIGSVMPVFLSLRNPLIVDFKGDKYGRAEAIKKAKDGGHDGLILRNHYDAGGVQDQYIVFDPTQIKSATGNRGTFDPNDPNILNEPADDYRRDVFYSALARGIESAKQAKAPAKDWKAIVSKLPGVKAEEIEAVGLSEWLDLQSGAVTREQVLEFVRQNGVQVRDVMLGRKATVEEISKITQAHGTTVSAADPDSLKPDSFLRKELRRLGQDFSEDEVSRLNELHERLATQEASKFDQWQLPGGENYRELLLTLPIRASLDDSLAQRWFQKPYNELSASERSFVEREKAAGPAPTDVRGGQQDFRSSHFDEPNILAHVRFNERTDADGKRVLFIEEVQSDWAQKGRKAGFGDVYHDQWVVRSKKDGAALYRFALDKESEAKRLVEEHPELTMAREAGKTKAAGTVPSAPFVTKTDSWSLLAMKRMIRYAAENGFDRIAWTTGEQQAERYDLSKQISRVEWTEDKRLLAYDTTGNKALDIPDVSAEKLADHIGKEPAQKLIDAPWKHEGVRIKSISGVDLKVGGEGMRAFYDQMLPQLVNKYVKKWGARVVKRPMDFDGKSEAVPTLDVPESMRGEALEGQPLFEPTPDKSFRVKPPKKLFRGVLEKDGKQIGASGTFSLGRGLYSSADRTFAAKYGNKVIEIDPEIGFPKNPLVLTNVSGGAPQAFMDWALKESGLKNAREFNAKYPDPGVFVREKGYDGVVAGDEIVKYSDDQNILKEPTDQIPITGTSTVALDTQRQAKGEGQDQLDLFTAPGERPVSNQQLRRIANETPKVGLVQAGTFRTALTRITNPSEAAHVVASIRKEAQENIIAVATDADGNIVGILRHGIGGPASVGSYPAILLGALHSMPKASKVWFAHNHPSGQTFQSTADRKLTDILEHAMQDTGLEMMGMLVVGPNQKSASLYRPNEFGGQTTVPVQPGRRTQALPVTERKFVKVRQGDRDSINNEAVAKTQITEIMGEDSGILLTDTQLRPLGYVPMSVTDMQKLRTGESATGAGALLRAMHEANATGAFVRINEPQEYARQAALNMKGFFAANSAVTLHDTFIGDQRTDLTESPSTFYANPLHPVWSTYQRVAQKAINAVYGKVGYYLSPLRGLPQKSVFLKRYYDLLGKVSQVQDVEHGIYKAFKAAPKADQPRVYAYLTHKDADPAMIADPGARKKAMAVKRLIDRVGERLVNDGLLSPQARDRHRGEYLPRVYLKYLLDKPAIAALGAGQRPGDMGYLKQRKDIPTDVRRLILGEVTDPGYLASRAYGIPARDVAFLDFFADIARNKEWIFPYVVAEWRGKPVSVYWLKNEADRLEHQAKFMEPAARKEVEDMIQEMRGISEPILDQLRKAPEDFKQVPDTDRYGTLRGLWVRREIHDLILGPQSFNPDNDTAAKIVRAATWYNRIWKTSKVVWNPPSQIRNAISNGVLLHLSGVPFHRVPQRVLQAVQEIRTNGKHWRIAKKYGVKAASFSNQEMLRIERDMLDLLSREQGKMSLSHIMNIVGIVNNAVGDVYQFSESLFKTAKIIDAMEREGMGPADAAIAAHDALFDYSLVPPLVKKMRTSPIGVPFLTFYYKAAPKLIETLVLHPERFLPYFALPYLFAEMIKDSYDVDDDDLKKLKEALPTWLREKGTAYILPVKDEHGRWQAFDYGYFMPWGMYQELYNEASYLASRGEVGSAGNVLGTLGLLGGPVPDMITAVQTNIDPFTRREISNKFDPPSKQLADTMSYVWRLNAPTWVTDIGAAGHLYRSLTGAVNPRLGPQFGEPMSTPMQAGARFFGVNLYPIDPEATRAENIRAMSFEIRNTVRRLRDQLRNPNLTPEQREEMQAQYKAEIDSRQSQLHVYMERSEVHPNLRRGAVIHDENL